MGDSTLTQTTLAFSTLNESAFNTYPDEAADYTTYETTARAMPLPDAEKQQDEPRIGAGAAGAYPTFQRSGVLQPIAVEIADVVNAEKFPIFSQMYFGEPEVSGDIAVVEASKAWRHFFYKQNFDELGRQLPSKSFIMKNNGAAFIYTGGVGGSLNMQQSGIVDPKFSFGVITSGNYVELSTLGSFGTLSVPTRDPLKDMMGAESILSYNDGSSRNLNGRWKSITWNANNNIDTGDLRAGLPRTAAATCPTRGWYRNKLLAGDESVAIEFRVAHDDVMREWNSAQLDTALTSFEWLMKGSCIPTTAAANQYSVKNSVGKCYFRNVRGGEDNNLAIQDVAVFPVRNGSYFGVWKQEIVNGSSGVLQAVS